MRLLELFCGTKSVGKKFEEIGYEVISLDYNPQFNATHTEDFLIWDYKQYSSNHFAVIWASPDCTTWSVASGGKYRLKKFIYGLNNVHQIKTTLANNMINKLIEILKYFNCKNWFIENPRGLLNHYPPLNEFIEETNSHKLLVYYGNYNNWGFPKATHIWSNIKLWNNETKPEIGEEHYIVKYKKFDERFKKFFHNFSNSNAIERSRIPPDLIQRILSFLEPE